MGALEQLHVFYTKYFGMFFVATKLVDTYGNELLQLSVPKLDVHVLVYNLWPKNPVNMF